MIGRKNWCRLRAGTAILLASFGTAVGAHMPAPSQRDRLPPIVMDWGVPLSASEYAGKPLLVNFWASWCAPCVREMPLLESLHHAHPELSVVGLAIDTAANVQRFIQKVPVSYELLLGGPDGISIMRELGNKGGGLPFTAFFDKRGRSQGVVLGELTDGVLATRLGQIL